MLGPIIRILLRYLAGVLVTRGLLSPDDGSIFASDPDLAMLIETGLGLGIGVGTEMYYWLAKRLGWRT